VIEAADGFVRVARVADIAPGQAVTVTVGERELALFHLGGAFHAVDNACPHQGGPLCEGWTHGATVTCPWHAWTFDLRTGALGDDDEPAIDVFEVRVDDGEIMVSRTPRITAR
jgi:nitrite reductase (NADH) small subunit